MHVKETVGANSDEAACTLTGNRRVCLKSDLSEPWCLWAGLSTLWYTCADARNKVVQTI